MYSIWHTDFTTNGEGEPSAATARRKLEPNGGSPNKYELGKPQAHGSGKARDGRKWGDVKTIRAKKPPIEALYPELPARRPNKG